MYIINKFVHFFKMNSSEIQVVNFLLIVTVEEKKIIDSENSIRRKEDETYLMKTEFRPRPALM